MAHVIRTAVVTGGSSGLGRAFVLDLARRGIRVVAADIDEVGLAETLRQSSVHGGEVLTTRCDVTDEAQVTALRDEALKKLGDIDCWINNAGVAVSGDVGTVPLEDWHWVVDINQWGMVYGCRAIVPYMRERGSGVVINVASAAGLLSPIGAAPYNVTKAAVVALSETLYSEVCEEGLGVTVVCPAFFRTNIMKTSRDANPRTPKMVNRLMAAARLEASDVARIALDDAIAGRLYSVAMTTARLFWHVKRLAPQLYLGSSRRALRAIDRLVARFR